MRVLVGAIAALVLTGGQPAFAETFQPQNLHVVGGEGWRADRSFALSWSNPEGVAAVHYRVSGPSGGTAVAETTLGWPATGFEPLEVPAVPGVYTAEVWLEDSSGRVGPPASTRLRFDGAPPGRTEPASLPAWIGRGAFPLTIRFGRPRGPEPLSGLRGYAFSIDRDPEGEPCLAAKVCGEGEIDLTGGADDDAVSLPGLPEGRSYLHAVAVSGAGVRSTTTTTVPLDVDEVDPTTSLQGPPGGWSNRPVSLLARATDSASGMAAGEGPATPFTAIRIDGGPPLSAPGDSVGTTVIVSGVHEVSYYGRDGAGNVADGAVVNGRRNAAPATTLIRIDRDAPAVAFAPAQDPGDPERIEAGVDDRLSGFDPSRGSIAVRPAGSRRRFAELSTSGRGDALFATWDSAAYPPGLYEFRVVAYDRAGNRASSLLRANGARMLLRAPLKIPTALVAGLDRRTVGFGQAARFSGRLLMGRRTPLVGRPVRVIERFDPAAGLPERVSTVRTGHDGRFAVRLAPGPDREVSASVAATPALAGASSGPKSLAVRGRLGFHASASVAEVGGRPLVFSGRVAGTPLPPDGKVVELQFRLPARDWSEFRTVTADARGRFRYAYRFVDDDSRGARFQFRAFAPAQAGWPYEAAGSRPVTVSGR